MRPGLIALLLLWLAPVTARAQMPPPLPATLSAQVGMPGSEGPRFANVTLELGTENWAIVGCFSAAPGPCTVSQRIVMSMAQRTAFVRLWVEVASMPRCEPLAFHPGDPEYVIETPAATYRGHLPASPADVPTRTAEVCAADGRLAWWLSQQLRP